MSDRPAIEVKLPAGAQPSDADYALLKAGCEAVVSLCLDSHGEWFKQLKTLEEQDWKVSWGLRWTAEASRGRESESSTAPSINEALTQLNQLVRLHSVEGCP